MPPKDKNQNVVPDNPNPPPTPPTKSGGVHTLNHPLNLGDREVTEVTPRRLTGKDQLDMDREIQAVTPAKDYGSIGSGERMMRFIGKSCGLAFEDVLMMDATDINILSERVNDFL